MVVVLFVVGPLSALLMPGETLGPHCLGRLLVLLSPMEEGFFPLRRRVSYYYSLLHAEWFLAAFWTGRSGWTVLRYLGFFARWWFSDVLDSLRRFPPLAHTSSDPIYIVALLWCRLSLTLHGVPTTYRLTPSQAKWRAMWKKSVASWRCEFWKYCNFASFVILLLNGCRWLR